MTRSNASTKGRKAAAAIYRAAARNLEVRALMPWFKAASVSYACHAIAMVEYPNENHDLCARMKSVFADEDRIAWLSAEGMTNEEERPVRILALCFMAAMVEAGDA